MKKVWIFIFVLLHSACSQVPQPDNPSYVLRQIRYDSSEVYPFIRYDRNFWQWKDFKSVQNFFVKLRNSNARKIKILHIGDSHVQAGIYPGEARYILQETFGYGGFGFLFPFRMIKTHTPYDYENAYLCKKYEWAKNMHKTPKVPLGITGAAVKILDPNTKIYFRFNENAKLQPSYKKLTLFCSTDSFSYDWKIVVDKSDTFLVRSYDSLDFFPYRQLSLSRVPEKFSLHTHKQNSSQKHAFFYGISLESENEKGLLYYSVGINGAGFFSLLRQERFTKDLKTLNPDLVIIDLGANDYFVGGIDTISYKKNFQKIIDSVKSALPRASILLSCSQDIQRYRSYSIKDTRIASKIAKQLAFENNCAFYNWYEVSGGHKSMELWYQTGMAKGDMIHLKRKGYALKSRLFANALLYSYYLFLEGAFQPNFDSLKAPVPENWEYNPQKVQKMLAEISRPIVYRVRSGDNLSVIAHRFGVCYRDIMRWNNLRSTRIYAGQKLYIYKKNPPKTSYVQKRTPPKTSVPLPKQASKNTRYYTIRKGDTLWGVARKFHVSVAELKRWNNLKQDKIYPGKKIKILK